MSDLNNEEGREEDNEEGKEESRAKKDGETKDSKGENSTGEDSEDKTEKEQEYTPSKYQAEELAILTDLWNFSLGVKLPHDVARLMTPFTSFRKMPPEAQKILCEALDQDAELREAVLEKWHENSPKLELEHLPAIIELWLTRPPRWRDEVDRFLIMQSNLQTLKSDSKDLQAKLRQAEAEQQRAKKQQDKRQKKTAKVKSQSEKDHLKRVQAEAQAEKLAEEHEAAKDSIRQLKADLASESDGLESLQRHHNKLRKTLSKREQRIQQLERELRQLQNPETDEETDERRRGFTREEIWGDANTALEPRFPVMPPPGVGQFSYTAAEHYVTKVSILFVDAYNFIYVGWADETAHLVNSEQKHSHKPGLEIFRNRLIDKAESLEARYRPYNLEQICLVFDGKYPGPQADYPPQSGIQVVFSPQDKTADDEIVERLSQYPSTKKIAVVSDDKELRYRCYDKGATIMSVSQLLHL